MNKIDTSQETIDKILNRGVADCIVKKDLETKLKSGKQLRIKLGVDPTGFDLHLGHTVVLRKLKQFQDAGHQVVFLIGGFTARIGDPTGKSKVRTQLTAEEVNANATAYLKQVGKIIDIKRAEIVNNADWLDKMSFADVVKLSACFTVSRMLERDMFQDRIKNNEAISVHEFLYPLMQGYDSVPTRADVELGGTDQTFNLLAGRTIQESYELEKQNILTVPILEGLDGKMKMGKSTGNYIAIDDTPEDIVGKTMSIPDDLIIKYYELLTDVEINNELKSKVETEPRNMKLALGAELARMYHGEDEAKAGVAHFESIFSKGQIPDDMPEVSADNLIQAIKKAHPDLSGGEIKRLIQQGSVSSDGEKIDNETAINVGDIIKIGKRKWMRVI